VAGHGIGVVVTRWGSEHAEGVNMTRSIQVHGRRRARAAFAALLSLALSALAVVSLGQAAHAAGTYSTTAAVTIYYGPGTNYAAAASTGSGQAFTLLCQWQGGTSVGGNRTWDQVLFANKLVGAIPDYYTTTPSFNSYAPGTGNCGTFPPTSSRTTFLGGVDMQRACNEQYPGRGTTATVTNGSSAYSCVCAAPSFSGGIDVTRECASQYGAGAYAGLTDSTNPYTWYCQGWGTNSTLQAVAQWAVNEKNSPRPEWSDYLNTYWSGWIPRMSAALICPARYGSSPYASNVRPLTGTRVMLVSGAPGGYDPGRRSPGPRRRRTARLVRGPTSRPARWEREVKSPCPR